MKHFTIGLGVMAFVMSGLVAHAQTVPDGLETKLVATGLVSPKGIDSVHYRAGGGQMGDYLYVAESGLNRVVRIDRKTGDMESVAGTLGSFPVGINCFGGAFGKYMYVANAMGGGLVKINDDGITTQFALGNTPVAGMDFGRGSYGKFLYVGEWPTGNIWRVDSDGNVTLFTTIPDCQTRYLKFSHGGEFGTFLYFTDFLTGDIYRVDPDGSFEVFASTGSPCLEGLAFGPGGEFGHYLYAGDLCTGEILRVDSDGNVELWAEGYDGVADIIFKPGNRGGFTMFIVDGVSSVYSISKL